MKATTKSFYRFLDTETTGLSEDDEVVELALLDSRGRPLVDTLVRPERHTRWDDAERIHGISPKMVKNAPRLVDLVPALVEHLSGHHLVVYNAAYDMGFMPPAVRSAPRLVSCAMEAYAVHYGEWNDYHGSYRWQRLTAAAAHIGHVWEGAAHRARADAHACRSVWRHLRECARDKAFKSVSRYCDALHRERVANEEPVR